jgi:hypothetical protein
MRKSPRVLQGDGLTPETAVLFEPSHVKDRIEAEREFICERYGTENIHWFREWHFTTVDNQSNWIIKLDTGESAAFFFQLGDTSYD